MAKKGRSRAKEPALATNRSASFEYHLLLKLEAGVVLTGPEVKSAREGRVSLKEAYAKIAGGEGFKSVYVAGLVRKASGYSRDSRQNFIAADCCL